jgi:GT2 family glycosyltransferase
MDQTSPASPRATVVVPTHRGAHRLPPLLAALEAQDTYDAWELVVVVDGPDAGTEALLSEWGTRLPLRVVRREASTGVAGALNAGYAAARGEVVIRCDDDLTPAPGMVRRHLAHHVPGVRIGVIGPTRDVLPDSPYARAYGRAASTRAVADALGRVPEERWRHWAGHNSVRRADVDAVGGFDESFSYREDSDLGLRLAESGVDIIVDPELEIPHRGAAADTRTRAARAWVSGASELLFERRHPGTAALPEPAQAPSWAQRTWRATTGMLATGLRHRSTADRAGQLVDAALPLLPPRSRSRVVALLVEASAAAGRRHGTAEQEAYRTQKATELERERRGTGH